MDLSVSNKQLEKPIKIENEITSTSTAAERKDGSSEISNQLPELAEKITNKTTTIIRIKSPSVINKDLEQIPIVKVENSRNTPEEGEIEDDDEEEEEIVRIENEGNVENDEETSPIIVQPPEDIPEEFWQDLIPEVKNEEPIDPDELSDTFFDDLINDDFQEIIKESNDNKRCNETGVGVNNSSKRIKTESTSGKIRLNPSLFHESVKRENKYDHNGEANLECLPVGNIKKTAMSINKSSRLRIKHHRVKEEKMLLDFDNSVGKTCAKKRETALARAITIQKVLKNRQQAEDFFIHTNTVRTLPKNVDIYSQQFYENRSPLHTTNNVMFSFNSLNTQENLRDWGLEELPPITARLCRILAYDVYTLYYDLSRVKLPPQMQKGNLETEVKGECIVQTASTVFSNAMSQTPDHWRVKNPVTKSIGVQTKDKPLDSNTQFACILNFPALKKLPEYNYNQLLALNDFAEFMCQPEIANDAYKARELVFQIYQRSQIPPVTSIMPQVVPPPPPVISDHRNMQTKFAPYQNDTQHVSYFNSNNYNCVAPGPSTSMQQRKIADPRNKNFYTNERPLYR